MVNLMKMQIVKKQKMRMRMMMNEIATLKTQKEKNPIFPFLFLMGFSQCC